MKKLLSIICLLYSIHAFAQPKKFLIVGTYNQPGEDGIFVYSLDEAIGNATLVHKEVSHNPSFLCISKDKKYVYAVNESAKGSVQSFRFNSSQGSLTEINKVSSFGDDPCYISTDPTGKYLVAGNYSSGTISLFPIEKNSGLKQASNVVKLQGSGANPKRQEAAHVHCAVSSNDGYEFVADLGTDKVMIYSIDAKLGKLVPGKTPFVNSSPGSGPRHFTFHPTYKFAYLIEELSGTVVSYSYEGKGALTAIQKISSITSNSTGNEASADIHISPDGKFLYCSNRNPYNNIAIFRIDQNNGTLTLVGHQPTLGESPRNFTVDPTGNFLIVANQKSSEIVFFKRNQETGLLTETNTKIKVKNPVFVSCIWITE